MIKVNNVPITVGVFPNGESFSDISVSVLTENSNEISFDFEKDEELIMLRFVKDFIDSHNHTKVFTHLVLATMPYDNVDMSDVTQMIKFKSVCKMLNSMNFDTITIKSEHSRGTKAMLNKLLKG